MIIDNGSTHGTFVNESRLSVAKVLLESTNLDYISAMYIKEWRYLIRQVFVFPRPHWMRLYYPYNHHLN
jgi:hypothetical protein